MDVATPLRASLFVLPFYNGRQICEGFRSASTIVIAGLLGGTLAVQAQSSPAPPIPAQPDASSAAPPSASTISAPAPTEALRPVLNHIHETLAGLSVSRWKAPGEVRSVTQRDIDSIQNDLSSTLPPLLSQANTPPPSVAGYFAVYRNIDAVYDVLLRVSETATLAGPQNDATNLQDALANLESARRSLGDAIIQTATNQQQELSSLHTAVAEAEAAAAAAAAKAAPPTKTVVDDGPASAPKSSSTSKRKKKAVPAPTATAPPAPQ
jgi:hypothetical protein